MITLITIGQTPREDLMKAFHLGGIENARLIGALDSVSSEKIKELEKIPGEEKLYVVLRDGMANINHHLIEERVEQLIREFENSSNAIAILCMSEFNCTSNQTDVIYPIKELRKKAEIITDDDATLIFVPIKEQLESAKIKWRIIKREKYFSAVHPKSVNVLNDINKEINLHNPNYVILDCYGFDYELVAKIENAHLCTCYSAQHLVVKKVKSLQ